jgi:single-stranded DNA-binding protein
MAGINKVILVGNVGRDPEIRSLNSGSKVQTSLSPHRKPGATNIGQIKAGALNLTLMGIKGE